MAEEQYVFVPELIGITEQGEFRGLCKALVAPTANGAMEKAIRYCHGKSPELEVVAVWVCKIEKIKEIYKRVERWPE